MEKPHKTTGAWTSGAGDYSHFCFSNYKRMLRVGLSTSTFQQTDQKATLSYLPLFSSSSEMK